MKNFWKISNSDRSVEILTYVPSEYHNGDGVYPLMKQLQKIYGWELCTTQMFDERFDKLESFNTILRTAFNLDGTRLICANLFDYNPKTNVLRVDDKDYKITEKETDYIYRVKKKSIATNWDTFREQIVWTMGERSCWPFWSEEVFGEQNIIQLDKLK